MANNNNFNVGGKLVLLNGQPMTLSLASADPGSAVIGDMYYNSTSNVIRYYNGSTWNTLSSGGGTVTSVTLAEGSEGNSQTILSFGGTNPVTSSGTIDVSFASQSQNLVLASPDGSSGQPYFRSLVSADIPSLAYANKALSNLTSATSINQSLIPASSSGAQILGSAVNYWGPSYIDQLLDSSGVESINAFSRFLADSSSNAQLSWSTSGISIGQDNSVAGILRIANGTSNAHIAISAANVTSSWNFNLPATAGSAGQVLTSQAGSSNAMTWTTPTTGTVTSVTFTGDGTVLSSTPSSAVTSSGTLSASLNNQSANKVLAGPTTGSAASPTFRSLVSADIPDLSATYVTQSEVGSASGVASLDSSGKVPVGQLPSVVMEYQGAWYPAATYASVIDTVDSPNITFTAVTAGSAGNSIALTFDGTMTVAAVVLAWNTANPSNTVAYTGSGTVVPAANTWTLSGGVDANSPSLSDGTGTNGYVYYVADAYSGTISGLNDPSMDNFQLGDLVIYSSAASAWQLVTPAAGVSSVNGAQGAVTVNAISQLTGDVTAGPASGSQSKAATIASNAVSYAKFQQVSASKLLGNPTGSSANVSEITLGSTLSFSSSTLQTAALSGDVTSSANSFSTTISAGAVTASKLGTVTDGVTLDQSGAGSTLEVKTGGISNSQINASAAIAYSKLNLASSVQASDQNSGAATSTQPLFADGSGGAAYRSIASGDVPDLSGTYESVNNFAVRSYNNSITLGANVSSPTTISALTFAYATYGSIKITYQLTEASTGARRIGDVVITTDGTNCAYNDIYSETVVLGNGIAFSAVVNGSNINVQFTGTGTNACTMRCEVTSFAA